MRLSAPENPRRGPGVLPVVLGLVLVVAVAAVVGVSPDWQEPATLEIDPLPTTEASPRPGRGQDRALSGPVGSWRNIPPSPPRFARAGHAAFWTGSRLLIWGGQGQEGPRADGGLVNPSNGIWDPLPDAPFPWAPGSGVVWALSHRELIVIEPGGRVAVLNVGLRQWREVAGLPAGVDWTFAAAAWDGIGVVLPGVEHGDEHPGEGGRAVRLRLDEGTWETLPDPPVEVRPDVGGAVAVATLVVAVGTVDPGRMGVTAWNPSSRRWSEVERIPDVGGPLPLASRGGQAFGLGGNASGYLAVRWGPRNGLVSLPPLPPSMAREGPPLLGVAGQHLVVWMGNNSRSGAVLHLESERWFDMPPSQTMGGRGATATMTWNGYEFLFWGGERAGTYFADGAAFLAPDPPDPPVERFEDVPERLGVWRLAPPAPFPRNSPALVWTGEEVLLWGGGGGERAAAYDPRSGSWRVLAEGPLASRRDPATAWTGEELLILGGLTGSGTFTDGAAFQLATQRWRLLPEPPPSLPEAGVRLSAWSDGRWYVLRGGAGLGFASYEPATDRWWSEPPPPEMVGVAMGLEPTGGGQLLLHTNALHGNLWAFDMAGRTWTRLADQPEASPDGAVVVWTGDELLVWGGAGDEPRPGGHAFSPVSGHWRPLPPAPIETSGRDPTATWTGEELYVWGTRVVDGSYRVPAIAVYDPATDRWSAPPQPPTGNGPTGPMIWTGSSLFTWFNGGPPRIFHPEALEEP